VIAEIHVSPFPNDTSRNWYEFIEATIGNVQASGLRDEAVALGTTLEGSADTVWSVLFDAHQAALTSGAFRIITNIRIAEASDSSTSMDVPTESSEHDAEPVA